MAVKRLKFRGKELPYQEGTVFAIPFREGGYTLGVVARLTRSLGVLVYLFDTVFQELPSKSNALKLESKKAVLKLMASGLYLLDGRWQICGELEAFVKQDWSIPYYIRRDTISGKAWMISLSEENIHNSFEEKRIPFDTKEYSSDSLYGAGAVEIEVEEAITNGIDRSLPYQKGFVFALPLLTGGYALGVVANTTKVGEVAFVYIFGKRFPFLPEKDDWINLNPKDAILKPRILDISLKNGRWPVLGKLENWKKEEWPMPKYFVKFEFGEYGWLQTYKDSCLAETLSSEEVPLDYNSEGLEITQHGPYGVYRIEKMVTDLLAPRDIKEFPKKTKRTSSKKNTLPYQEGSIFAIPLQDEGYGIGVVTCSSGKGDLICYLYKDRYTTVPTKEELPKLDPQQAFLKLRTGDAFLLNGSWPILGMVENWDREQWPIPKCIYRNPFVNKAWIETFSDKEPARPASGVMEAPYDIEGYLKSIIYAPEAVAFELTQAILYGVEKPLLYQEGSVFAVPLEFGGYALGVVARTTKVGEVAVVYLFKEKFSVLPEKKDWSTLDPKNAFARPRVLDTKLQNGSWPILGIVEGFTREEWPMPQYLAREKGFEDAWVETYKETCPARRILSRRVPFDTPLDGLEEGSLFGPYRPYQIEDMLK